MRGVARRRTAAFTLIELMIVVAVIAVLSAIAIPSYLKAQIRANASRVKSDLRSLSTALEAYAITNGDYPPPGDSMGRPGGPIPMAMAGFVSRLPPMLTTPLAYIQMDNFVDPFVDASFAEARRPYRYINRKHFVEHDPAGLAIYDDFTSRVWGGRVEDVGYYILSHGPDLRLNTPTAANRLVVDSFYDPTNGAFSSGDLLYFGSGYGFKY